MRLRWRSGACSALHELVQLWCGHGVVDVPAQCPVMRKHNFTPPSADCLGKAAGWEGHPSQPWGRAEKPGWCTGQRRARRLLPGLFQKGDLASVIEVVLNEPVQHDVHGMVVARDRALQAGIHDVSHRIPQFRLSSLQGC